MTAMKNLTEETFVVIGFLIVTFLIILLGFGTDAYYKYLDTYNTQKDRELFLTSYEIVIECRKSYGVNTSLAVKMCGELPVFTNEVK